MTPQQANEGVLELGLPNGESVLVAVEGDVPGRADVDDQIIAAMLTANEHEDDVCAVVSQAMAPLGLLTTVSNGRHSTTLVVAVDRGS
jgi:hypothetical protein